MGKSTYGAVDPKSPGRALCADGGARLEKLHRDRDYGGNWTALFCSGDRFTTPPVLADEHVYRLANPSPCNRPGDGVPIKPAGNPNGHLFAPDGEFFHDLLHGQTSFQILEDRGDGHPGTFEH